VQLLGDIKLVFGTAESMWTEDLLRHLHEMPERPWCEYGRQRKPISPRQLASLLKPFGIAATQVWKGSVNKRGYTSEQFFSAWARYLSASPLEATDSATSSDLPSARGSSSLAHGNPPKSAETAGSSTLANSEPVSGRAEGNGHEREQVGTCPVCRFTVFRDNSTQTGAGIWIHPVCARSRP
jgi:Protein of unknown function (DUF3631)